MDVESEIRDLKRRVGEPEGSFSFLTGQVRDVHRSLLSFQEETNARFDRVETDLGGVKADLGAVKDDVRHLREDLPGIVGGAVREALRDR
jgi:hypothetical protein